MTWRVKKDDCFHNEGIVIGPHPKKEEKGRPSTLCSACGTPLGWMTEKMILVSLEGKEKGPAGELALRRNEQEGKKLL